MMTELQKLRRLATMTAEISRYERECDADNGIWPAIARFIAAYAAGWQLGNWLGLFWGGDDWPSSFQLISSTILAVLFVPCAVHNWRYWQRHFARIRRLRAIGAELDGMR